MKKNFLYFFCFASFLFSCMAEQDNELLVGSCFDKIKNQNEEEVDCGGICGECIVIPPVVVPCESSLINNRVTFDGFNFDLTSEDFSCTQEYDHYTLYVLKDWFEMEIEIYEPSLPIETMAFDVVPWYNMEDGKASIRTYFSDWYNALSGTLYVSHENNSWTLEFCTTTVYNQFGNREVRGKVTCD